MAERAGFEPARQLPTYTLSKRAPSATRTPLQSEIELRRLRPASIRVNIVTGNYPSIPKTEGARFELA